MQTDIVEKAGIEPKTLLSSTLYWQKLEGNISSILFLPYLVLLIVTILTQKTNSATRSPSWEGWLLWIAIGGIIIGTLYNFWAIYLVPRIYAWRVRVFAKKNNLQLIPQSKLIELIPDSLRREDVHNVRAVGFSLPVLDQHVTVFDYTCVVGSGKHAVYLANGLVVMQLKGDYPHLYLDGKNNGKNYQYAASQKVQLEGDFSKYFDVYMPEGSQAGSLTVFAPDMMQTVLDTGKLFDVEIHGTQAVIISNELVFTRRVLPNILNCAAGLSKEFRELDRTWQPVFTPNRQQFTLKGQPVWRNVLIALAPIIIALSFNLLPENIKHPIKNPTVPVVSHQDDSPFSRDAQTLAGARQIADKLNVYTSSNLVPDSLIQAHISNPSLSISYTKLSPSVYQLCATYNYYINGNGPTGAYGNIVLFYGATIDSPNLPSTLQIVEWHNEGKNCQVIRPRPSKAGE